ISTMHRNDLVQELQDLGLTSYEARCYVALASLGPSDPAKVAAEADIPKPSAYTALRVLASKGWVDLVVKKPAVYRAKPPGSIKAMVSSRVDGTFEELAKAYRSEPADEAELVYTIRGADKVLAKIYELVRESRESVVFVSPTMGMEDSKLLLLLEAALARGVKVRALGDEGALGMLPPGAEIRIGSLVAVDLLVDDKVALIALPDYSAAGWIDSPAVASHFKQFLELMWNTSSPP
ncbi:MAG TPA: helix-turn-helix domain-containing protein, partial [Nitrososphaerales archaeon]|nr:helix-turn-helix domain-containing protein [Nitrososphaerales archaeon]